MIGAHLHHGALMLRHEPEQNLGHAGLIVEIARGAVCVVLGGENVAHHAAGGGLPGAAGDAHQGDVELAPVGVGQGLEGFDGICDTNMGIGRFDLGKRQLRPLLKGLGDEPMPVEHVALDRYV